MLFYWWVFKAKQSYPLKNTCACLSGTMPLKRVFFREGLKAIQFLLRVDTVRSITTMRTVDLEGKQIPVKESDSTMSVKRKCALNDITSSSKYTICIEGNIGSGKTTFLNYYKNCEMTEVFEEPVKKWRDIQGHNGLAMMYKDPSRWGLTFQTYVQLTMLKLHTSPHNKPIKMMERSIYSAKYCFVENLHRSGKMPDLEHVVLTEWFDWILKSQDVKVDLMVYLQTKPETVYERIKHRHRHEEKGIPLEYLQTLHNLHEDWLIHKKYPCPFEVLVLDGNPGVEDMVKIYEENRSKILQGHSILQGQS